MIWALLVNVAFGVVLLGCFPVALVLILRRARGPARVLGAVGVVAATRRPDSERGPGWAA